MKRETRIAGLRRFFRLAPSAHTIARDIDEELRFHIDSRADDLISRGASADDARTIAAREFGDVASSRAELASVDARRTVRDRRAAWWDSLAQDVGYALRGFRRNPSFSVGIALTFALGIGINSAVFRLVDRMLLRMPAGVAAPRELRRFSHQIIANGGQHLTITTHSYPDFEALRHLAAVRVGAYRRERVDVDGHMMPVLSVQVADGFLDLLGVHPHLGRFFASDETRPDAQIRTVVLSYNLWRTDFGADPNVLGQTMKLSGNPYQIVGVVPRGFSGVELEPVDLWLPLGVAKPGTSTVNGAAVPWYQSRNLAPLMLIFRVAHGISDSVAAQQIRSVFLPAQEPMLKPSHADLRSILGSRNGGADKMEIAILLRLAGVSALILIVACASAANLMLARTLRRRREIAVRLALGISRARLVRQLLVEGLLLSAMGGALAMVLGYWSALLLRVLLLPTAHWQTAPADPRILAFTAILTFGAGLAAALSPAIQASDPGVTEALKSTRGSPAKHAYLTRSGLIVAQAALSVVLLVGAGLFIRSLQKLRDVDLGVRIEGLMTVWPIPLGAPGLVKMDGPKGTIDPRIRRLEARIAALPEVAGVALVSVSPFDGVSMAQFTIPGREALPVSPEGGPYDYQVSPNFFEVLGTRIVRGRGLTSADRHGSERVIVINEAMAKLYWPGSDPVGACVFVRDEKLSCARVVGIAKDIHTKQLIGSSSLQYFQPIDQSNAPPPFPTIFARTRPNVPPATGLSVIQQLSEDGIQAMATPVGQRFVEQLRPWIVGSITFGLFGALALALAAIGLYSVVSYTFADRTHEFGVRRALGASSGSLLRLALNSALRLVTVGVIVGIALAVILRRLVANLLYEVSPADPLVLAAAAALSILVCLGAAVIPARRAARIDPMVALRAD